MNLNRKLSQEDIQRIKDKTEDVLLHPDSIKENQDISCPKIFWNGMGHGSEIGEWSCVLNPKDYGDLLHGGGKENTEYLPCYCQNYNNCPKL